MAWSNRAPIDFIHRVIHRLAQDWVDKLPSAVVSRFHRLFKGLQ